MVNKILYFTYIIRTYVLKVKDFILHLIKFYSIICEQNELLKS